MYIGIGEVKLRAPWVHSLKEKRMVVRRITERVAHKFNVSIAEVSDLDIHQSIVIGMATVSNSKEIAEQVINSIVEFIEGITDAEILSIDIEVIS